MEADHGSPKTSRLTCSDAPGCEHLLPRQSFCPSVELSRCVKYQLTCLRALPGVGVSTVALATQMMTAVEDGSFS